MERIRTLALLLSAALGACTSTSQSRIADRPAVATGSAPASPRQEGVAHNLLLIMAAFGGANPNAVQDRALRSAARELAAR